MAELRIPVSLPKLEGPSTTVTFLAIVLDSARLDLRLSPDKVERIRGLVCSWLGRRFGRWSDLETLLGYLSYAAVVVKPGRIFLWQLFSLLAKVEGRHHFVYLNAVAKVDLVWWDCFLQDWHGARFVIPGDAPSVHVHSDAAGNFGCGAVTSSDRLLQVQWPSDVSIAAKEMAPVAMAAATWGQTWHCCNVFFHCDNTAVVAVIQRKSTRDALLLHLLHFYAAFFQFSYSAHHLPGVSNVAADALLRGNMSLFLSLFPQGVPSTVSWEVMQLLLLQWPDGGSRDWIRQFKATL